MKKPNKKIKSLEELSFDSIGDEYIYLFETISQSDFSDFLKEEETTIEYLRELYNDLVKNSSLDIKYKDSKRYWFKEQEKAIIDYVKCENNIKKNEIFNEHLYKPLNKLIENIIFTYKLFRSDSNIKDIQHECLAFLMTKMEKFNPETGAQAFSYFGTIAKHFLMGEQRNAYKFIKSNVDIDEKIDEASEKPDYNYEIENNNNIDINLEVFEQIITFFEKDLNKKTTNKLTEADIKIAEAIVVLFKNHELIGCYNKNKIYFFIKEHTRLTTKKITNSITKYKKIYKNIKTDYIHKKNK